MDIRFHLDENVHTAVAHSMRRRGIDVTTPSDAGLLGAPDERHMDFAREERRVIVTHDSDYLRLNAQGVEHAGIAFCPAGRSLRELIAALARLVDTVSAEAAVGQVIYL